MSKGSPSPPPAPDPYAVANAQANANQQSAAQSWAYSNPAVTNTPLGSQTLTNTGTSSAPHIVSNITLDPQVQAALTSNLGTTTALNNLAGNQMGRVSDALSAPYPMADPNVRQEVLHAQMGRLQPFFDHQQSMLDAKLAAEGNSSAVNPVAAGWDQKMLGQQENDALLQADANAGNEMARQYQLQSTARELPLNELSAIRSSGQVQTPQFQGNQGVQVGAAPVANSIYQSQGLQGQIYNAQVGQQNALYGALGQLGGASMFAFA